jgi:hypothetical protein
VVDLKHALFSVATSPATVRRTRTIHISAPAEFLDARLVAASNLSVASGRDAADASHIRDYWIAFSAPLEGLVDFMYLDARGWVSTGIGKLDQTAQEMSPPTDQERSSSPRLANYVMWTVGDRVVAQDEVAAAWEPSRPASTSRPKVTARSRL